MKICLLSFYFKPDLCAGSFRNTALVEALQPLLGDDDHLDVITTMPNRYATFKVEASEFEAYSPNIHIYRSEIPKHRSGFFDQINSFRVFYNRALRQVKNKNYDLVIASSSRLFTAFLGARVSIKTMAPLYLDIRDLFRENILEVIENPFLSRPLNFMLKQVEHYTFSKADHINIVSEGFREYFEKYNTHLSFYPNGIDEVFLEEDFSNKIADRQAKIITYAGNIGEGQGLHKIIPKSAKALELDGYQFRIIGDGGARDQLENELNHLGTTNVELIKPVDREKLMQYYRETDYLFLHLNNYKAFKKVLPSKIFEYAATGKPILAGVGGYARSFLEQHVDGLLLFDPCDVENFTNSMKMEILKANEWNRDYFCSCFARSKIMSRMAEEILNRYRKEENSK